MNNILSHSDEIIRINKFLSKYGYCSRRVGDKLIEDGLVYINNEIANLGSKVLKGDTVYIKNNSSKSHEKITKNFKPIYIALNKPLGVTSTTDKNDKSNIIDFVNFPQRIFPIGRLDKNSHGLILLTNDGEIVNKILRSEHNHEKEYLIKVDKPLTNDVLDKMRSGVRILGQMTKPCKVSKINDFNFKMILTQGLNRQIRRMCDFFEYRVINLKRIRILNIELNNLEIGKYRELTSNELETLFKMINYKQNLI